MAVNVNGGALEFDAVINGSQFQAQIDAIEKSLKGLTQSAENEGKAIEGLVQKTTAAIAAYASFATATNFVQDIVKVRGEFQQLEVAFQTMLGSKAKADKLMAEVTQFAATTPFELSEVAGATKQLLAFGLSADSIKGTLRSLGDVAAGIGAPIGEIAYLYGTIKTAGVANNQDIKQFAQRGIPIYEELAKVLKTSVDNVGDLVTAGKVGFPEIEAAFASMTAEGSRFGGLMEAQSKTLTGQLSNLSDAWAQMLNNIGKSGEGVFSDAIGAATSLVQNYETVIDILKVLVATYGSYKAAVLATNVVQAIATAATQGYTIAETLRFQAMLLSERAMKLLNRTMLSNPAVAVATGIGLLVSALLIFRDKSDEVKTSQELLADVQAEVGNKMAETEAKIRPYVEALKNANLSENERVSIYEKLKAIDPDIVKGLNAKTISYQTLTANVNAYLDSLRKQLKLEANKEAATASIKQEQSIEAKLKKAKEDADKYRKAQENISKNVTSGAGQASAGISMALREAESDIVSLSSALDKQRQITSDFGSEVVTQENTKQEAKKRTVGVIDEEIKALRKSQTENSANAAQYQKFQNEIKKLEEEKEAITGKSKKSLKQEESLQSKINTLLDQRRDILLTIENLKRDAKQSGLLKEQSELDKINEKYDTAILKVKEYNDKVAAFNKKNGTKQQGIGLSDINALNAARQAELKNAGLKEDAEKYKAHLQQMQAIFEKFETSKKQIGAEKAKELYGDQLKGFESYAAYLTAAFAKLAPKIQFGIANVGEASQFNTIVKELSDLKKKQSEEDMNGIVQAFTATLTYKQREYAITVQYEKDLAALKKLYKGEEFEQHKVILKQKADLDKTALQESLVTQSTLLQKLGQSTVSFSKNQLKKLSDDLAATLKSGKMLNADGIEIDIPPAVLKQLKEYIKGLNEAIYSNEKLIETAGKLDTIAGGLNNLSSAVAGINSGLGETIKNLASMAGQASSAMKALNDFKIAKGNNDSAGQFAASADIASAAINVINGIVKGIKEGKATKKAAEAEIRAFQLQLIAGEEEYQRLLRNRELQLVTLNKLTLQGLKDQKELLETQKKAGRAQYENLLKQIQAEQFVSGEHSKKKRGSALGGLVGIFANTKTEAVKEFQSLAGKSFDELEELFTKGQLTDKAKALFEQLRKLKDEGQDLDALLEENKRKAQEIFTGTTSDSILDSIVEGFKNGQRSAADFAGNFEDLMKGALLNSLKFQYLEGPLKDFFAQFAEASQSGGSLDNTEIAALKQMYNDIINGANDQFAQLQQVAGLNFATSGAKGNTLTGAFKTMTEETANLLAGQFGGLRLTALDQLNLCRQSLLEFNKISYNTGQTVVRLDSLLSKFDAYENGSRAIKVQ